MPVENDPRRSGLECLRVLFGRDRPAVNYTALMTPETLAAYAADPVSVLTRLAEAQQMRPEVVASLSAIGNYAGPALMRFKDGAWTLVFDVRQFAADGGVALAAPTLGNRLLQKSTAELEELLDGTGIIFRNLAQVDAKSQTRLTAFTLIARHHNKPVDIRELMHTYAVDEGEVRESLFRKIVHDRGFHLKRVRLSWKELKKSGTVFPCIAVKPDGTYAVFCGFRSARGEGGETPEAVLVDPASESYNTPEHFVFLDEKAFAANFGGQFILLKPHYRLTDENRPFGLGWFIPEFVRQRAVFGEIALMVLLLTVFSLVTPLFFQIVVDKVLVNQAYNTLNVLGVGILCVIVFNALVNFVRSYLLLFATNKIDIATATKTFMHLMKLPVDFFDRVPSGVLLKHMQQTEKIRGFLSGNLFFTILDVFALCVFVPFLLFYSTKLTAVVVGFSALMALVIASLVKPFQRRLDELYQAEGKRQSMLVESIHGVKTVKSLALEPVQRKIWDDTTAYAIKSYFRVGKISMTAQSISQFLEMAMTVCVIWIGAYLVFEHQLTMGALIAFQMLAGRVTGPLVKMVGLIHEYQQVALSVRMLGVVMNAVPEPAGGGVRNPIKGAIDFEGVSFRYRPDLPVVVNDFSLNIRPGQTIGFVGRSGSGKTTVTKLLQGLYSAQQGLVKIDGIDIRELDKAHLRRHIGVVLQENYFFSGTVRANISLPKQNATLEEVIYVAKLAGADEFVSKLPRGYDTVLEENAANLSGGQKQRLAIARALLTNPPILIFDEATSALDPESEEVIRRNLKAIARGRTVLIVSHRLSIVGHADRIVVIDRGRIAEMGTHSELVEREGIYRDFWKQQMCVGEA